MIFSGVCITLCSLFVKQIGNRLDIATLTFFRLAIPAFLFYLISRLGYFKIAKVSDVKLHLIRAVSIVLCQYCFLYSLLHGSLFLSMLLFSTGPIFMPILSKFFLAADISRKTWLSIFIGFLGVLFILKPSGNETFDYVAFVGLGAGFFNACSQITFHQLSHRQHELSLAFYMYTFSSIVALPCLLFFPHADLKSLVNGSYSMVLWLLIFGIALGSMLNQITKSKAYKKVSDVSSLAPFIYIPILFSALLDWTLFKQTPSLLSVIGASLVVLSGLVMVYKKSNRKLVVKNI